MLEKIKVADTNAIPLIIKVLNIFKDLKTIRFIFLFPKFFVWRWRHSIAWSADSAQLRTTRCTLDGGRQARDWTKPQLGTSRFAVSSCDLTAFPRSPGSDARL